MQSFIFDLSSVGFQYEYWSETVTVYATGLPRTAGTNDDALPI
jgi:hypothetical protein